MRLDTEDDSDGFAARVAAKAGWRLANLAVPDTSASCYGVDNVGAVIANWTHRR